MYGIRDYLDEEYGSCGCLKKISRWPRLASGIEQLKQETNVAFISSPCRSCTLARVRCPTQDAATERLFLVIHNSGISYPNNLKF